MINFTVGPVQSSEEILAIGKEQVPYFRTSEFSELLLENERLVNTFASAPKHSRTVFLTGSGSLSMEAAVMNTLSKNDKVLVVNGGSFGERFVELCALHEIPFEEIKLSPGKTLRESHLLPYESKGFTAFLINMHETSTGVLYDMKLVGDFCQRNHLFFIADCISSFLSDPFDMEALHVDIMMTGSQKALACPPGISLLTLSPRALERLQNQKCKCQYLDLKLALENGSRGQTPWTPAVGILRQIHSRLKSIEQNGGALSEVERTKKRALYFRTKLSQGNFPFEISSESLSNAVTPLHPTNASAYEIFLLLKDHFGIWICPNGGELKDEIFRVGHIGELLESDYDKLLSAFSKLQTQGLI